MEIYISKLLKLLNDNYKFFVTLITLQVFLITSANAQIGRVIKPLPTVSTATKMVTKTFPVAPKIVPITRQSAAPIFNRASQNVIRRENVSVALRSSGIRKNFNVATGSGTRLPATISATTKLPALNFGKYAVGKTSTQIAQKQATQSVFDIRKLFSSKLSPKAKSEVGKAYSEATSRATAINTINTQSLAVEKHFNNLARLHKNRSFFKGPSHAYTIVGPDGRLYKVGESSAGLQKTTGLSNRAQAQVNKLNRDLKKLNPNVESEYRSRIISTFTSKQEAKEFERQVVTRYIRKYKNQRNVLPGNKESFSQQERK